MVAVGLLNLRRRLRLVRRSSARLLRARFDRVQLGLSLLERHFAQPLKVTKLLFDLLGRQPGVTRQR